MERRAMIKDVKDLFDQGRYHEAALIGGRREFKHTDINAYVLNGGDPQFGQWLHNLKKYHIEKKPVGEGRGNLIDLRGMVVSSHAHEKDHIEGRQCTFVESGSYKLFSACNLPDATVNLLKVKHYTIFDACDLTNTWVHTPIGHTTLYHRCGGSHSNKQDLMQKPGIYIFSKSRIDMPEPTGKGVEIHIIHDDGTKQVFQGPGVIDGLYNIIPNRVRERCNLHSIGPVNLWGVGL